jgi:hypothetical protein
MSRPVWFSRLGRPFAASEQAALAAMLAGHAALARAEVDHVEHWHEAGEFVRAAELEGTWWDLEEEERARLWECASDRFSESDLLARLAALTRSLTPSVQAAAAAAAKRAGVADRDLVRTAAGAALMAAHQRALAALAGAGGAHLFDSKYALFAGGRWPLGHHRGRFAVF